MTDHDEEIQDVLISLSNLAPGNKDAPRPASQALARLRLEATSQKRQPLDWRIGSVFGRRSAFVTVLVLIVLVSVAFSSAGVRAAASDFLGLFRVQKFAAISISPEQLALIENLAESGLYPGDLEMIDEPGEPRQVTSIQEAEETTGLRLRTLSVLGEPDRVFVIDGGSGRLVVNVENARAIVQAAGADPTLIPDSLDGATVAVTVYSGIAQNWGNGTALMQAPSPLVEYPDDVDPAALGEALLQALGMEPQQAQSLAQSIDWTNTLLLPIPENLATFSEVVVDDVTGLALSSIDGQNAAILWEKKGHVYVLSGTNVEELTDVAQSIR